jgi:hypothetical protein
MAITATTAAVAVGVNDQTVKVTSATGATVGGLLRVDAEYMDVLTINGTTIGVSRRGQYGGVVAAHNILARAIFCLATDLVALGPYTDVPVPVLSFDMVNIGANGAIPVPVRDTWYRINKGSALASSTFANPGADQDGLTVTFTGITDFAHVVTTVTVNDGTTGAHTTLTSAAFAGSSLTLRASAGTWQVVANNLWVIT